MIPRIKRRKMGKVDRIKNLNCSWISKGGLLMLMAIFLFAIGCNGLLNSAGYAELSSNTGNAPASENNQEFIFIMTFTDDSGGEIQGEYPADIYCSLEDSEPSRTIQITSGGTISISGGQFFVVRNLPYGTHYSVMEEETAGWELIQSRNSDGVIGEANNVASFHNAYAASGKAQITAHKNYVGGDLGQEVFEFEIHSESGELICTASTEEDGTIVFPPLNYTAEDDGNTFLYYVSEVIGEDDILYDSSVKEVSVSVKDIGNGEMETKIECGQNEMEFINRKMTRLIINKTVYGNIASRDKLFSYNLQLRYEDGSPYTTPVEVPDDAHEWHNPEAGVYTFKLHHSDSITLVLPAGIEYILTEDPEDYLCRLSLKEGEHEILTSEETPTIDRILNAKDGDTKISYMNYLEIPVPTGIKKCSIAGFALTLIGAVLTVVLLSRKRQKRGQVF